MAATNITTAANVQQVTKKSSDELLRKFAEVGGEDEAKKVMRGGFKRRRKNGKTSSRVVVGDSSCESPCHNYNGGSLVERRSLLPVTVTVSRKSVLLKQLGICRSHLKASRDIVKNKSFLTSIEKTWRRTLEGASRVILENHYNRHRRLINDMV